MEISYPFTKDKITKLRAGDIVSITGTIYTARDAAHKRLCEAYDKGEKLPIDLNNIAIYFAGPSPAKPNEPIGSVGPTTSYRMDAYSPITMDLGLSIMIGKGKRSKEVIESMKKNKAVYIGAIGGAGALLSSHIKECEVVAYPDLGSEAIHKLYVENFPGIVIIDCQGNNLYETEYKKYRNID